MAEELLASVSGFGYKQMVPFINERDAISLDTFKTTKLAECFIIDTSQAFVNGRANPNHIYDLFGDFARYTGTQVRLLLLKHITRDPGFHMRWGTVCLEMRNISLQRWLNRVADDQMYCDELGILSLSHMYRCHTLVVTVNKMWSTIKHSSPLNLLELLNECSVKLIYLGQLHFGELKPRPIRPPRPMPSLLEPPRASLFTSNFVPTEEDLTVQPNVQINSSIPSEHYACTTSASASISKGTPMSETEQTSSLSVEPNHVETASEMPSVETRPNSTVNMETENGRVHVETQITDQNTSHVETNADVPAVSQVNVETLDTEQVEPNKTQIDMHKSVSRQLLHLPKTAKLVLEPLKDLEIDVWCRKTSDYYRFVPPMESSMNSNNTGYSLHDRKPKVTTNREKTISVSLRKTNSVNYAPMLDSASEESDEPKKNTPNKTRPKPDGPSTAVLNAQIQNKRQKNFETKPVPILPVRNLQTGEPETGAANVETPNPVETSTPVETTPNDSETELYVNTESESENKKPVNRTLVMKTVGIV